MYMYRYAENKKRMRDKYSNKKLALRALCLAAVVGHAPLSPLGMIGLENLRPEGCIDGTPSVILYSHDH